MKRIVALVCLAVMMLAVFTGCGAVKKAESVVETMVTDASEMLDGNHNNGTVTDGDGYINESSSDNNHQNSTLNDGLGETTGTTNETHSVTGSTSTSTTNPII